MQNLFVQGDFTLNSGLKSKWKIECDALSSLDWMCLARMASAILPPYNEVIEVPTGGNIFATYLRNYSDPNSSLILVADDVLTTGGSMERMRMKICLERNILTDEFIGVVAFSRGQCPMWITPLFQFNYREFQQ